GTAELDLAESQIATAQVKATLDMDDGSGKKLAVTLETKMSRTLGKELLNVRDKLTLQSPRDAKNRPFKVHTLKLEANRPCVVSLESPKGTGWFDTLLRVEDGNGKLLFEDNNSGVDTNSLIEFTPQQTGTYRIVATCSQPTPQGNYLLVVRQ